MEVKKSPIPLHHMNSFPSRPVPSYRELSVPFSVSKQRVGIKGGEFVKYLLFLLISHFVKH
jgi:hypothetical protein